MLSVFSYALSAEDILEEPSLRIPKIKAASDDTPLALSEKAQEYFNNKEYYEAIGYYQAVVDNFDTSEYEKEMAWAYYEIGFCYYYMEKYDEANKYFDVVLNNFSVQAPRILSKMLKVKILEEDRTFKERFADYKEERRKEKDSRRKEKQAEEEVE